MGKRISILPDNIANQIAAGEVVQRPASIVKELLENSLDSGASEIQINIMESGKTSIQIIDNGCGIPENQLKLAFIRHATSKLKSVDDLFSLSTMGFRGEALASISAISQVTLKSRIESSNEAYQISVHGIEYGEIKKDVGPVGSVITVKNLFYNVPARRQFLKADPIEFRHIADVFTKIALANPETKLTLHHNKRQEAQFEPENLRQRISHVLGKKANENLVPVSESTELVSINGYVLRPENARKSKGNQYLFVNKRPIKSGYLHKAITKAFEGLLSPELNPSYVLKIIVPSDRVDVNVHPSKTEVKFEDERAIYAILRSAVKRSLGIHQITPTLDFENNLHQHISLDSSSIALEPKIKVNLDFNPFNSKSKRVEMTREDFFKKKSNKVPKQESLELSSSWDENKVKVDYSRSYFLLPPRYIITSLKTSLVIINIERAKNRILFDQLISALKGDDQLSAQSWVFPEIIQIYSKNNFEIWSNQLKRLGYHWEIKGDEYIFSAGPLFLNQSEAISWLEALIQESPEDINLDKLTLSWVSTMKNEYPIIPESNISNIIDILFECDNPWTDPNGKTVTRILDSKALAEQFK
tara:strand:+ start:3550 stop:5313 length:1764 start_codon:yes stop_codon:yes gene_type:complete